MYICIYIHMYIYMQRRIHTDTNLLTIRNAFRMADNLFHDAYMHTHTQNTSQFNNLLTLGRAPRMADLFQGFLKFT